MNRASPSQQRKALEIANVFVKMGVGFVPMPVVDATEFDRRAQEAIEKLSSIADSLESPPAGADQAAETMDHDQLGKLGRQLANEK